jgi:hypothetical protein
VAITDSTRETLIVHFQVSVPTGQTLSFDAEIPRDCRVVDAWGIQTSPDGSDGSFQLKRTDTGIQPDTITDVVANTNPGSLARITDLFDGRAVFLQPGGQRVRPIPSNTLRCEATATQQSTYIADVYVKLVAIN